jgi:predicted DNA binding CopG/RHH family protein
MSKGRNTTRISVRLPDRDLAFLKDRAKGKGVGYTVMARHLIQEKPGLPKR